MYTPRGPRAPAGGPPRGGPPAPGLYTLQGGWWMAGDTHRSMHTPTQLPQPLFPRVVSGGLFRTQTSLSTRFDQRQVLTHTLTREWVPSSSHSLRPRHLGRSRGLSHFAPTGWGISSLAGAIPSSVFSPSVYPHQCSLLCIPSRGLVEFRRHDGLLLRPMAREPGSRLCLPRPLRRVLAQHGCPVAPSATGGRASRAPSGP